MTIQCWPVNFYIVVHSCRLLGCDTQFIYIAAFVILVELSSFHCQQIQLMMRLGKVKMSQVIFAVEE